MVLTLFLTNDAGHVVAAPVVPVPRPEPKDVLVDQVGHAVLAPPVVGLVVHPVEKVHLPPVTDPRPVAVVAVAVVALKGQTLDIHMKPGFIAT